MGTRDEINEELKELGSPLAGLSRTLPYAVPDGYFHGLADGVMQAVKKSGVPAGYFQTLPAAMLQAAKAADVAAPIAVAKKPTRVIALPMRRWAAAAVLLLSFGIGGTLLFSSRNASSPDTTIASLPQEDIAEYAASNIDALDVADGALASADATITADLSQLSETELEDYLADEGLLF